MKKWLSYTIDGVLLAFIGVLAYVQVSMLVTRQGNHGVPMAFGHSFLYVTTNSMDDAENNSIWQGNGIVVSKVPFSSLVAADPILDGEGKEIDFDTKTGDVVTFFHKEIAAVDTHRLVGIKYDDATSTYMFQTMGDNPTVHERFRRGDSGNNVIQTWDESAFIGKVVHHSEGLGNLLLIASPDAAASKGQTAWLLPVTVGAALGVIAVVTVIDVLRTSRRKKKEEEAEMNAKLIAAGIDLEDEEAVETFKAKEEFKAEYRAKLEEETEKAKMAARKEMERKKKGEKV